MLHMLDTDVSSYIIKEHRHEPLLHKLSAVAPGQLCVSAITRAELLYGLKKLSATHELHLGVPRFLRRVRVLAWEAESAEFYAQIRHDLTSTGQLIGELDMLIAAHAIAADAVLVTNNVRHFRRIKLPLMMENWME